MVCRKTFDHAVGSRLTGAKFAKTSDVDILAHAQHWANTSGLSVQEGQRALNVLRKLFGLFSKQERLLLETDSALSKRIGLIKQCANRSAAHISLGNYELRALDFAHFVSTMLVIGTIIGRFDDPARSDDYYDKLDKAAHEATLALFPDTHPIRLFRDKNISRLSDQLLQIDNDDDLLVALDKLAPELG